MRTTEHSIKNHMAQQLALANCPQTATELAEKTACDLNIEEVLDDPEAEVWTIAAEFFGADGHVDTWKLYRALEAPETFTINSQGEKWLN